MLPDNDPMQCFLRAVAGSYTAIREFSGLVERGASKLAILNALSNVDARMNNASYYLGHMENRMSGPTPCASQDDLDVACGMETDLCLALLDAKASWHAKVANENRGVNHGTVDQTAS